MAKKRTSAKTKRTSPKAKRTPALSGRRLAEQVFEMRQVSMARRARAITAHLRATKPKGVTLRARDLAERSTTENVGFLIAAGDSWFDYPGEFLFQHDDIISLLEEQGYTIESSAHAGDPIEAMAYNGAGQLTKLARCFEKIQQQGGTPKAILLSGGGDDIAGDEFGMLINNSQSKIAGWNGDALTGVIDERIETAYEAMLDAITSLSLSYVHQVVPILVHGYDYAVPDGRGYLGGWSVLPGPWLQPGFTEKQFTDLSITTDMIKNLIDRFNAMLQGVAAKYPHVHYIDLRGTLSNALPRDAYKTWWANELHPTPKGFQSVTDLFAAVLAKL